MIKNPRSLLSDFCLIWCKVKLLTLHWSTRIIKRSASFSVPHFFIMLRFRPEFGLDDEEDNAQLGDHLDEVEQGFDFFVNASLRSTRATFRGQTQKLRGMIDATWRWGSFTRPNATTHLTPSKGRSAPTHITGASPQRSRSPSQRSLSHQYQFQSIETLVSFHSHASQKLDRQDTQSPRNHPTDFTHVELQRTVPIGRFLLLAHFSHSRSRTRCREETDPQRQYGHRKIIGSQKECRQNQERGRTVLRTRHRHHEGFGRCQRGQSRPRLQKSQARLSRPRTKSQRIASRRWRARRSLWITRDRDLSTSSFRLPSRRTLGGSTIPDHLQRTSPRQTDHSHQSGRPLSRVPLPPRIPRVHLFLPRVRETFQYQ